MENEECCYKSLQIASDTNEFFEVLEKSEFFEKTKQLGFMMSLSSLVSLPIDQVRSFSKLVNDNPELVELLLQMTQSRKRIDDAS